MIIGGARVSATEQNLGLRHDDLKPAFDASVDQYGSALRNATGQRNQPPSVTVRLTRNRRGGRGPMQQTVRKEQRAALTDSSIIAGLASGLWISSGSLWGG